MRSLIVHRTPRRTPSVYGLGAVALCVVSFRTVQSTVEVYQRAHQPDALTAGVISLRLLLIPVLGIAIAIVAGVVSALVRKTIEVPAPLSTIE